MSFKFRIISVDKNEGSFVVRYYSDSVTEDDLATSIDIDGEIIRTEQGYPVQCRTDVNINVLDMIDKNPTLDDIKFLIYGAAPTQWLDMKDSISNENVDTNLTNIESQIGQSFDFDEEDVTIAREKQKISSVTQVETVEKLKTLKDLITNPEVINLLLDEINRVANSTNTLI